VRSWEKVVAFSQRGQGRGWGAEEGMSEICESWGLLRLLKYHASVYGHRLSVHN
jgi:hypothetical protein